MLELHPGIKHAAARAFTIMIPVKRLLVAITAADVSVMLAACTASTGASAPTSAAAPAASTAAATPQTKESTAAKPPAKPKPTPTVQADFKMDTTAQKLAIQSAVSYLQMGSGFSRKGLYEQLTSDAGEGIKKADALNALKAVESGQLTIDGEVFTVDWNKQAVESAKSYVDGGLVSSRADLIEQLTSDAGEQFTLAQARYAAKKVGL
jgi:hypothetical protein